jgi:hypothetical protein
METSTHPTITDEEGKVFHIVPELLTFMDKESAEALDLGMYDPSGYPPGCSACHFNRKERRQPRHPSQSEAREHCNSPFNGRIHNYACGERSVIFVSPRNLKRYQARAAVARLTGELK